MRHISPGGREMVSETTAARPKARSTRRTCQLRSSHVGHLQTNGQYRRTAQGIVSAWKVWVQFQKAHRIHKQRSKQRTKQKRDDLLEQAQQSARAGNLCGLWKVVKQLAPKAPRRRLQLHKDGQILSPDEELQWIVQAYGDRYGVRIVRACLDLSTSGLALRGCH